MKSILYIACTSMFFSCGSQKEVVSGTDAHTDEVEQNTEKMPIDSMVDVPEEKERILGIVHLDENCGAYIEAMISSEETKRMYPVNLDAQYKTEDTRIKFYYELSRGMIPNGCMVDMTVSVSDVSRMR